MGFDLGGSGGNAFQFNLPGDSVTGKVMSMEEVQQTDMKTGELQFWNDNPAQPKMMFRVVLQTSLRDEPDDDGLRAVYLRGSRKSESKSTLAAVLGAVKHATGGSSLDPGGTLTLTYVGDGAQAQRGFSPPKMYEASYRPPSMNIGDQQQERQAMAPAQPAPQYQQQQYAPAPAAPQQYQQQAPPQQYQQPPSPADIPGNWPPQQQAPAGDPQPPQQQPPAPPQQQANGSGLSPEQEAALKAAGIDPATVAR